MNQAETFNILMYSHDTYGLGHIRRTMAIAGNLRAEDVNVLILTGSPIPGRFSFPEQVDFVRIPGMIKKRNDEYLPLSIKIHPKQAMDIRKRIITATVKAFKPHLFIVDKEPLGLKKEVLPTLKWIRRQLPRTRTVLGLRDVMDDSSTVIRDWRKKKIYDVLESLYTEIWVYGNREIYDPVAEYRISDSVARKMVFTGYIPRRIPSADAVAKIKREHGILKNERLVIVTTGGGGDGYPLLDVFLSMAEQAGGLSYRCIVITGPFMPRELRRKVFERARRVNIRAYHFFRHMEKLIAAADLVVSMGGYNTLCEILTNKRLSLIVPREKPRREQLIRAEAFCKKGLVDFIPRELLNPRLLGAKIEGLLEHPERYKESIDAFEMTGIEKMKDRLGFFKSSL